MITASDSSVLFDIFGAHPRFGAASAQAMKRVVAEGQVVACPIVWSEISTSFTDRNSMTAALSAIPVVFSEIDPTSAFTAGVMWKTYRQKGGSRIRMLADFLIGAHALGRCDRLLTRDAGFFRTYFKDLKIIAP